MKNDPISLNRCEKKTRLHFFILLLRMPTCRVLWRDGPSVEHLPVPGDGPHLVGSSDGDGLEGLVGAHVEPGAALRTNASQRDDLTASESNSGQVAAVSF